MSCQCDELGVLRVTNTEQEMDSLVYCGCEWSRLPSQIWILPQLNRKISTAFSVERVPLAWFLPDNERESVPRGTIFDESLVSKIQAWHKRLKDAEGFWTGWGNIFEDTQRTWP